MARGSVRGRRAAERAAVHEDAAGIDLRSGREGGVGGIGRGVHARLARPAVAAAVPGIVGDQERRFRRLKLPQDRPDRSEEHTSELQSRLHLVCRLLLEKKKKKKRKYHHRFRRYKMYSQHHATKCV